MLAPFVSRQLQQVLKKPAVQAQILSTLWKGAVGMQALLRGSCQWFAVCSALQALVPSAAGRQLADPPLQSRHASSCADRDHTAADAAGPRHAELHLRRQRCARATTAVSHRMASNSVLLIWLHVSSLRVLYKFTPAVTWCLTLYTSRMLACKLCPDLTPQLTLVYN